MKKNTVETSGAYGRKSSDGMGGDESALAHHCMQGDRENVSTNLKNVKMREGALLESTASRGSSSLGKDLSFQRGAHSGKTEYAGKGNYSSHSVSGRRHGSFKWVPKGSHSGKTDYAGELNSFSDVDSGISSETRDVPGRVHSGEKGYGCHKYDTSVVPSGARSTKKGYPDEGSSCSDLGRTVPRGGGANSYSVVVSGCNGEYTGKGASGGARAEKTGYADKGSSQKRRSHAYVQAQNPVFCYDICPLSNGSSVKLKAPLHLRNREIRNEKNRADGIRIEVLRPGMLLLKHHISLNDQVTVIRTCRELGIGPGGFYQPGYQDGAKLRLKMMCFGKIWDPETSKYGDFRPCDGSKPPPIPDEFHALVLKAMEASHSHLRNMHKAVNVEDILPSMVPNTCIANFYAKTGKLGLHQDKDESRESLSKGLPVVSFSIGDSAEFLYGDHRDVEKVEKVVLESGDVLIFGGKARHVYHGISTIFADTAPKYLLEETILRPGRLNLTFREY